jgi:aldehyde dehydrogenase (NAD+)
VPFSDEMLTVTVREPLGVIGAIIFWNVPMLLMALKIVPALVAGNSMVVKSAEEAPLAVLRTCQIMNPVLPPGVFNILSARFTRQWSDSWTKRRLAAGQLCPSSRS